MLYNVFPGVLHTVVRLLIVVDTPVRTRVKAITRPFEVANVWVIIASDVFISTERLIVSRQFRPNPSPIWIVRGIQARVDVEVA